MLPGFPKKITTKMVEFGRYIVSRDDGKEFTVIRDGDKWWINNAWTVDSLKSALHDLTYGNTDADYWYYAWRDPENNKTTTLVVKYTVEETIEIEMPKNASDDDIIEASKSLIQEKYNQSENIAIKYWVPKDL